jgi:hypothetical protein
MRFLSILTALLLVPALAARRGATPAAAPATRKHILVPQWGFPYGWGLGPDVEAEGIETPAEDQKTVKQVKRGTPRAKSLCLSFE